jgi:hypothetical protein
VRPKKNGSCFESDHCGEGFPLILNNQRIRLQARGAGYQACRAEIRLGVS